MKSGPGIASLEMKRAFHLQKRMYSIVRSLTVKLLDSRKRKRGVEKVDLIKGYFSKSMIAICSFTFSCFLFYIPLLNVAFASPPSKAKFIETSAHYLDFIPEGTIIQGSASHGGIQPDYVVDFESPRFAELRENLDLLKANPRIPQLDKVAITTKAVSSLLKNKHYSDKSNYLLAEMYKNDGMDIPLSEYVHHETGVCREHALILHFALSRVGIPNHFVYAKIQREVQNRNTITEDHAFNTIKHAGREWVIDAYYGGFHGFDFEDLKLGKAHPNRLPGIADYPGNRSILHLNKYPLAWIPRNSKVLKCEWIFQ